MSADEIKFLCPRCERQAFYYPAANMAGCPHCGVLLYTEIPSEIARTKRWQTIGEWLVEPEVRQDLWRIFRAEIKRMLTSGFTFKP